MKKFFQVLMGFALLGAIGYGLYALVRYFIAVASELEATTMGPLLVAAVTLFGSVLTMTLGKHLESRALVKKELRERKAKAYEHMIKGLLRLLFGAKLENPMTTVEWQQFYVETVENLTIWGSDEVVRTYGQFRQGLTDVPEAMRLLGALLLAVRKDLGHGNVGLTPSVLLSVFVNDLETVGAGEVSKRVLGEANSSEE